MGIVSIKEEEAVNLHKEHYESADFKVAPIQRKGPFDFFPFSIVYGLSDIGCWNGTISTDGKKVVVTKGKFTDMAKVKKKWILDLKTDVKSVKNDLLSSKIILSEPVNGLSMVRMNAIFKFILTLYMVGIPILLLMSGKLIKLQIDDDFGNAKAVKDLLLEGDDELQSMTTS